MRAIVIIAVAAMALNACGKPAEPSAASSAAVPAGAPAKPATPPEGAVSKAHLIAGAQMAAGDPPTMDPATLELTSFTTGVWPVTLYDYYNLSNACAEHRIAQRIIEAPKHGTLSLEVSTVGKRMGFQADDPRTRCDATDAPLYQAIYTPAPGFKGKDRVVLEINDNGYIDRYGLTVEVR